MKGFIILGNQLFPQKYFNDHKGSCFFMAEDVGLCTHYKYHKHKIILFLSAMRHFCDELEAEDYKMTYSKLSSKTKDESYISRLLKFIKKNSITHMTSYEIEDKFFETQIKEALSTNNITYEVLKTPFFITSRDEFSEYLKGVKRPFMRRSEKKLIYLWKEKVLWVANIVLMQIIEKNFLKKLKYLHL